MTKTAAIVKVGERYGDPIYQAGTGFDAHVLVRMSFDLPIRSHCYDVYCNFQKIGRVERLADFRAYLADPENNPLD